MLKTLEAIIGVLMILVILVNLYQPIGAVPEFQTATNKLRGFHALKALDDSNDLRADALSNDTSSIESKLSALLPTGINYKIVVCAVECEKPEIASESISSVDYVLAGNETVFSPRKVVLYIW